MKRLSDDVALSIGPRRCCSFCGERRRAALAASGAAICRRCVQILDALMKPINLPPATLTDDNAAPAGAKGAA